jgi:hypothetical protein
MHTPYTHEADITQIVFAFQQRTLPLEAWTHNAHLTVALWHVREYGALASVCLLRGNIIAYNIAVGTPNTTQRGYHETLTLFWIAIIDMWLVEFRAMQPHADLTMLCNTFLTSEYALRELPLRYYEQEELFSVYARAMWLLPTLKEWKYAF